MEQVEGLSEEQKKDLLKSFFKAILNEEEISSKGEKVQEVLPDLLTELRRTYEDKIELRPGDLIQWKNKLKNRKLPKYGDPAIVMEVLESPVLNTHGNVGDSNFNEACDIKIGMYIEDTFVMFYVDGHRFQKYHKDAIKN